MPYKIERSAPAHVRKARECFLGAQPFNILSVTLRNLNSDSVESFKNNLGSFRQFQISQQSVA